MRNKAQHHKNHPKKHPKKLAENRGRAGERRAEYWLRLKGWRILDRRIKTPRGEVDIIAKRGNIIAFIEVKWRGSAKELDFAVDEYRLDRVAAAAEILAQKYVTGDEDLRIDVILLAPKTLPRHIANAWQP